MTTDPTFPASPIMHTHSAPLSVHDGTGVTAIETEGVTETGGAVEYGRAAGNGAGMAHTVPPESAGPAEITSPVEIGAMTEAGHRAKVRKAPNAFRTISEVADDLHIPQHVLRFWETRFPQVNPMKRGGGRRYYRPDDIALLRRIADLLYIQGYTIKGVQRLLCDGGGLLSEDIPPAPAEEREAAAAEHESLIRDEPPQMIPGLDLGLDPSPSVQPARPPQKRRADPEAERLRAVLIETLTELEAIRALIG